MGTKYVNIIMLLFHFLNTEAVYFVVLLVRNLKLFSLMIIETIVFSFVA